MPVRHALIPCLRYADAPAAIDFLARAFGFERQMVHLDPDDARIVLHAQLTLHSNMVMLGSDRPGATKDRHRWRTPSEAGGVTTCVCAVIDDPDGHAARAAAAGAEILSPPADNPGYPGRGYDARDPEGHVWTFTSYDPWATG